MRAKVKNLCAAEQAINNMKKKHIWTGRKYLQMMQLIRA